MVDIWPTSGSSESEFDGFGAHAVVLFLVASGALGLVAIDGTEYLILLDL
jgi:hypothetical protein